MPPKRRATGRKAPPAKRVAMVAQRRKPMLRNMVYACKKRFWLENWQPNTATTAGFWRYFAFSVNQLPDYATLNATFDTFRINAIKVEFHPRFTEFAGNDTTDTTLPGITNQSGTRMSLLRDQYSTLVPTGGYTTATYNSFLEQGPPRTYTGTRPFSIYFKPVVSEVLGASVVNASRMRAPYMQLEQAAAVPHAGFFAYAWDPNFTGTFGNSFDLLVTYYIKFRGQR